MDGQGQAANGNLKDAQTSNLNELDFWEAVDCAKCHLRFAPEHGPSPPTPFWLTECGHILCNSHLTSNRSCLICNAQDIELIPLQKEMPPPMSDWFCSIPMKLDNLAHTVKFQQESLLASLRYFRNRCDQYRGLLERVKKDIAAAKDIKKENEMLKQEISHLRGSWNGQSQSSHQEPSQYVNGNGKRRLVDSRLSTSSPRSIHTPLGPPRITLPPDQDPPLNFARPGDADNSSTTQNRYSAHSRNSQHAPTPIQQYAYNPPQTPQLNVQPTQVLSHAQQAPIRQVASRARMNQSGSGLMLPPPTPDHIRQQQQYLQAGARPIATPIPGNLVHSQGSGSSRVNGLQTSQSAQSTQTFSQGSRRFVPSSASGRKFVPPAATSAPQRFVPSTPSTARRF